jgi:hypothetical protein
MLKALDSISSTGRRRKRRKRRRVKKRGRKRKRGGREGGGERERGGEGREEKKRKAKRKEAFQGISSSFEHNGQNRNHQGDMDQSTPHSTPSQSK